MMPGLTIEPSWLALAVGVVLVVLVLALFRHRQRMAMISKGLYKEKWHSRRRANLDGIKGGLWLIGLGGAVLFAINQGVTGWSVFWVFILAVGVIQVITSLIP